MLDKIGINDNVGASLKKRPAIAAPIGLKGFYEFVCRRPDGSVKWKEAIENLVVTEGRTHALETELGGGTQITSWFIGLTDGTPTVVAGNTAASHAGWAEVTAYDEATREAATFGTASAGSIDNSASVATFTISTDSTTIGGAFLISNNTKGGTSGVLYSAGAFTGGDKAADDGDTLDVTVTFTASSS